MPIQPASPALYSQPLCGVVWPCVCIPIPLPRCGQITLYLLARYCDCCIYLVLFDYPALYSCYCITFWFCVIVLYSWLYVVLLWLWPCVICLAFACIACSIALYLHCCCLPCLLYTLYLLPFPCCALHCLLPYIVLPLYLLLVAFVALAFTLRCRRYLWRCSYQTAAFTRWPLPPVVLWFLPVTFPHLLQRCTLWLYVVPSLCACCIWVLYCFLLYCIHCPVAFLVCSVVTHCDVAIPQLRIVYWPLCGPTAVQPSLWLPSCTLPLIPSYLVVIVWLLLLWLYSPLFTFIWCLTFVWIWHVCLGLWFVPHSYIVIVPCYCWPLCSYLAVQLDCLGLPWPCVATDPCRCYCIVCLVPLWLFVILLIDYCRLWLWLLWLCMYDWFIGPDSFLVNWIVV